MENPEEPESRRWRPKRPGFRINRLGIEMACWTEPNPGGCAYNKEDWIQSRTAWKHLYSGAFTISHLLTYWPIRNSMAAGPVGSGYSNSSPPRHLFYLNTLRTSAHRTLLMCIYNLTEKEWSTDKLQAGVSGFNLQMDVGVNWGSWIQEQPPVRNRTPNK